MVTYYLFKYNYRNDVTISIKKNSNNSRKQNSVDNKKHEDEINSIDEALIETESSNNIGNQGE